MRIAAGWPLVVLSLLLACAATAAQERSPEDDRRAAAAFDAAAFDAWVERARETFEVPGIAVAIVRDGEVVLARGYGLREMGRPEPVDADTLFAIASNTKAFTAMSLSILADEGRLDPDDHVIDHLPWFRMSDPYVTREMRVRDLLTHRSGLGLGAGDLLYWPATDYSTREVVERLAFVPLSGGFRERYAYDNILYGVAQLVIEQASGMSYAEFLQARILDPLGMSATRFNSDHLRADDRNIATGHARADFERLGPVGRMSWSNLSGAGGLYSSVNDLSKWMRVLLDGGRISGEGDDARRLVSDKRLSAMWSLVTPMPIAEPAVPELAPMVPAFAGYGEGWNLSDFRGRKLVWHTGGWPGMVSRLTLVPEERLGIVVLTNQETGAAFHAITLRALDAMFGTGEHDWIAAYAAALAKSQGKADEDWRRHLAARDAASTPSLPLAKYAGRYRDAWYGDVVVAQEPGGLMLRFTKTPQLVGDLEHWQHDSFIVRWRDRALNADAFVTFALDQDGAITGARMEAISPLTDFSFDFHDLRLEPVSPDGGD